MSYTLTPSKVHKILQGFRDGKSIREIAADTRVATNTVKRYRKRADLPPLCRCGRTYGHRGWCTARYEKSLFRQYTLHPEKLAPLISKLPDIWRYMPEMMKLEALRNRSDAMFRELTLKTKLLLIESAWVWVEDYLRREKIEEEQRWIREGRKTMRAVRAILRERKSL